MEAENYNMVREQLNDDTKQINDVCEPENNNSEKNI